MRRVRSQNITKVPFRKTVQLILLGLVAYLVIAGLAGLQKSLHAVILARPDFIFAATSIIALSYAAAALTYCFLVVKAIPYGPILLVQIAGGLVNRLLPAGLGGLGLNALYIHRRGHSAAVATAIVALNNTLGFVGNLLLVVVCVSVSPLPLVRFPRPHISFLISIGILLGISGIVLVAFRHKLLSRLVPSLHEITRYTHVLLRRPGRNVGALASSMAVTALHASALFVVIHSLGYAVSWPVALIAISSGALTGAAVPTPGGLGGAEAGIAAALVALSMPSSAAVAAAITYRGLTYWIPLLPGYLALRIVEKQYI